MAGIMLPYALLPDFLPAGQAAGLREHALSHEADFAAMTVGGGRVVRSHRSSSGTGRLGPYRQLLRDAVCALPLGELSGVAMPPHDELDIVTELVASNDGDFYARHTDTHLEPDKAGQWRRLLTAVYYFNTEPRPYSGGELRLHAVGGDPARDFVDIVPRHYSLSLFVAWVPHEILPVSCPSRAFADSRFSVNLLISARMR